MFHNKTHNKRRMLAGGAVLSLLLAVCNSTQTQKPFTVGMIAETAIHAPAIEGFKTGMAELGYEEGEDIVYVYNGVSGSDTEGVEAEIKNLLAQQVDLLFALGTPAGQVTADSGIPVVFGAFSDPVGRGIVEDLQHPGGNVTGVRVGGEIPKALEWLVQITPNVRRVYVPYNPDDEVSSRFLTSVTQVASQLKIELVPGEVHSVEEAVTAIEGLPADIQAIFRIPSPTLDSQNSELSQATIKRGLPMVAGHPLDEAVLLTLASNMFEIGKQAARLAHQIRQGVKPADLPVETAEFYLTVNLKTAQTIDLNLPDVVLYQADIIIY